MIEYMKQELDHLENQRRQAREVLSEVEKTVKEIKGSTGYKIHSIIEKNNVELINKILTKHDGTHVIFSGNEIRTETLDHFKNFKMTRMYAENGRIVVVFKN